MFQIYEVRGDGVYTPVRYYVDSEKNRKVTLVGTLHVGEKSFYGQIGKILQKCDVVIYEEIFPIDAETMKQLDLDWSSALYTEDLDEAFLAAIFLPMPPQKFMYDHGLQEETNSFDHTQAHWISGDGAWGRGKEDAGLSDETWNQIRQAIRKMDQKLKEEKVSAAKEFLRKVDSESASMHDYVSFRNLHEAEIEKVVNQPTVVVPRDEMTFDIFDEVMNTRKPSRVGIKLGNGHLWGMDRLLCKRAYALITVKWLRALAM